MTQVVVLRYGHRHVRDFRTTTHCCLVARGFGAEKIIIEGEEDKAIVERVKRVNKNWGGKFGILFSTSWRKTVEEYKNRGFVVVHLTMYGSGLLKEIKRVKDCGKLLVLIGSQKVEKEVYGVSNYNISVTNQPHSEIAALAVFLDRFFEGKEMKKLFCNAKIKIIPSVRGKIVEKLEE